MWVVNTVPPRTACNASANDSPWDSVSSRMRSTPWKPAWPSLAWKTSGCGVPVSEQYARTARTPPMPSSISWRRRWSSPPP